MPPVVITNNRRLLVQRKGKIGNRWVHLVYDGIYFQYILLNADKLIRTDNIFRGNHILTQTNNEDNEGSIFKMEKENFHLYYLFNMQLRTVERTALFHFHKSKYGLYGTTQSASLGVLSVPFYSKLRLEFSGCVVC